MCVQNIHVVQDKTGEKRIEIKVYGPHGGGRVPRQIVKFSRNEHAIANSDYLRLPCSDFFRDAQNKAKLSQGQHDDREGSVIMGFGDQIARSVNFPIPAGSVKSEVEFRDTAGNLLFCCAAPLSTMERKRALLSDHFPAYDTETEINDVSGFALQLGINAANSLIKMPLAFTERLSEIGNSLRRATGQDMLMRFQLM